ncbi:hypothetical protein MUK42_07377 [Musa troglodytarum]|uniref:Uncharacterized protein n=1 Tax=Musa troglodytarum TaxID=320322 RepID=A0A9E7HM93_9LILI|nr:hypothetical protein MUK42_07377 [Musa troglodytarum]
MRSASSVSPYCGYALIKSDKASGRGGRHSWFVKRVFGKMESFVSFAKFIREIPAVVALAWRTVVEDSTRPRNGTGQQPWLSLSLPEALGGLSRCQSMRTTMATFRRWEGRDYGQVQILTDVRSPAKVNKGGHREGRLQAGLDGDGQPNAEKRMEGLLIVLTWSDASDPGQTRYLSPCVLSPVVSS